jgi:hypothetical protein
MSPEERERRPHHGAPHSEDQSVTTDLHPSYAAGAPAELLTRGSDGTAFTFRQVWWRQVRADPDVFGPLLTVALAVSTEAWPDGTQAVMSAPRLAKDLKMGESTARRHLTKLQEMGYLRVTERGHRRGDGSVTANVFELSLPLTQMSDRDVSTSHPDERLSESQPDASEPPVSTAHPDERLSESQKEALAVSTAQNDVSTAHPGRAPLPIPSKEISQLADIGEAADEILNAHRLQSHHRRKIVAALQGHPDPLRTAAEVCSDQVSKTAKSRIAVVLARIKAARNGETRLSTVGGAPVPPDATRHSGWIDWDGQPILSVGGAPTSHEESVARYGTESRAVAWPESQLSSGGPPAPPGTFTHTGRVSF